MSTFYEYLWALWQNWWWFVTSGPYIVEALVKQLWSCYENWANKYVSAQTRRKASTWLAISGVFVAGFRAFSDQHDKLQEAQKQIAAFQEIVAGKQQKYGELMRRFSSFSNRCNELMFSNITTSQYPLWKKRQEDFRTEMTAWVEANLGQDAKERLIDMSAFTTGIVSNPVDPDQYDKLIWLDKACHNLLSIMQDVSTGATLTPQAHPH